MPARDNQAMGARLRDALWSGPRALRLDPVRPIELFDAPVKSASMTSTFFLDGERLDRRWRELPQIVRASLAGA